MKAFVCENCGSNDVYEDNGFIICNYCGTKHIITHDHQRDLETNIDLQKDVARLLEKCKEEPERAKKYAQRILEIDPNNIEAIRILNANIQRNQNTGSGGCYIATAVYGSYDCPQVWTLRRYRDNILSRTRYGRALIRAYYSTSPTLVKWFGDSSWFINFWKSKLDHMVRRLNRKGISDTPYVDI